MDSRIRVAFLALVGVQLLHSIEEYARGFYEVFPPAQLLENLVPGLPHAGFIVINTLFFLFGLWCFIFHVRPGTRQARDWVWLWGVIELFNGVAHSVWAVATQSYVPGLATASVLFVLASYLFARLRGTPETPVFETAA